MLTKHRRTYSKLINMNFDEFTKTVESLEKPVILLEGSRNVLDKDVESLINLAAKLAQKFPKAIFRSGGASGSDNLFAAGISQIDKTRLHLVFPNRNKIKTNEHISENQNNICFEQIPESEQKEIFYLTKQATSTYISLVEYYEKNKKGRLFFKAQYLLRDALKVVGSNALKVSPANIGCFYVNSDKATGGGTGHTIRICKLRQVPVIEQSNWIKWL